MDEGKEKNKFEVTKINLKEIQQKTTGNVNFILKCNCTLLIDKGLYFGCD